MAGGGVPSSARQILQDFLFGTPVFVCVLIAGEDLNSGDLQKAGLWAMAGVVLLILVVLWAVKEVRPSAFHAPRVVVSAGALVPNWPLRELFAHLSPGLLSSKDRRTFEAVAAEITDKLSTGQIMAWGRAIHRTRTLPLFPIPENYWLHAKLNIWLLDDDGGDILQAAPVDVSAPNKTQYREILINQAQALAEWPKSLPPAQPLYTSLRDAAVRVMNATLDNEIGSWGMREPTINQRLDWYAYWITGSRKIPLYGKRPPATQRELLPQGPEGLLARYKFRGGAAEIYEGYSDTVPAFTDLEVREADLLENWERLCNP